MTIYVKGMVSYYCTTVVIELLKKLGLQYCRVDIGEMELIGKITEKKRERLRKGLANLGFELLSKDKADMIEGTINIIIQGIHYSDEEKLDTDFHKLIAAQLKCKTKSQYQNLSHLFFKVKSFTIQHFIIIHKIELAKKMLIYDKFTLTEISEKLNYSSVQYLSTQFKNITGLNPTNFILEHQK